MAWTSNPSHFRVFRFLFGRGTDVHLPSQENEIQPISQQPTSVSKFIICLFRHAEKPLSTSDFYYRQTISKSGIGLVEQTDKG